MKPQLLLQDTHLYHFPDGGKGETWSGEDGLATGHEEREGTGCIVLQNSSESL